MTSLYPFIFPTADFSGQCPIRLPGVYCRAYRTGFKYICFYFAFHPLKTSIRVYNNLNGKLIISILI